MTTAQDLAGQHAQNAQTLSQQAATAVHPQMQAELSRQAGIAQGEQIAATRAADTARGELEAWQRRGQDAERAYQQQAITAQQRIQAATDRLRPIQPPAGGAPIPVNVTPADAAIARRLLPLTGQVSSQAWAEDPGAALARLAEGRALTPGTVLALYDAARQEASRSGQGSLLDGLGGFVSTATLGLVSFGNSSSARYRGGEIAAMIHFDPEALVVDGERLAARELAPEEQAAVENWVATLPRRESPTSTPAYKYEVQVTGPSNYRVQGAGERPVWADGVDTTTGDVLEAKHLDNPPKSPLIEGSAIPPKLREKMLQDIRGELVRYKAVVEDPATPVRSLRIITSDPRAVPTLERLMREHGVPGQVVVVKPGP